ncbi:hypothetical protein Psi02_42660 [Planotetraspora silvatica]|uniref:DUF4352 domain-containing protein n=1 Tax=Planotetraspora silvatica TaxID=234614 RepID=A0A8J3XMU8_9ACTN|nr:hypothetical protein [Planotetraspora silvatica]GII47842.1 hypothetical protein Psi02_42660 [Planotetraspora silvatica]
MACADNGQGRANLARGSLAVVLTLVLSSCSSGADRASPSTGTSPTAIAATTTAATDEPTAPPTEEAATEAASAATETPETEETVDQPQEASLAGGSYEVTIKGTAGWADFERGGTVRILDTISEVGTTNEVNVVDLCLISGFPGAQPEAGAIWFSSNSGCDPGASAANIDLAYVEVDGQTVTVRPDEQVAATLGNNFTAGSGLAAGIYAPVSGQMSITVDEGGNLSGSVDIMGYGGAGFGQIRYQAEISGNRV